MNPEQIRTRGLVHLVVGAALAVLVGLIGSVVPEVPSTAAVAATVFALLVCLGPAVVGGLSLWIFDAESATRLRPWFVLVEGVVLVAVWPFLWTAYQLDAGPGGFDLVAAVALSVPTFAALVLTLFHTLTVHRFVAAATPPRLRSLGIVMLVVAVAAACGQQLVIAALPVSAARATFVAVLTAVVALVPIGLGVLLTRVRPGGAVNPRPFALAFGVGVLSVSAVGPALATGTALGVVFAALVLVSLLLPTIALLTLRAHTGVRQRV